MSVFLRSKCADKVLEPSNMLDVPSITFLSNYLQNYPSTLLVVSHDRAFLNEVATDIIHQHSERLDYYKGADFGKALIESIPDSNHF